MVNVRFFATIREITGQKETTVAVSTLEELLKELAAKNGLRFQQEVYGSQGVSDEVIILVNGRHLEHLPKGLKTELDLDDTVAIFPLVGGG